MKLNLKISGIRTTYISYSFLLSSLVFTCMLVITLETQRCLAQQVSSEDLYLYDDLWINSASDALAGANGPFAKLSEAPLDNPSNIGGSSQDSDSGGAFVKQLNFPYYGLSLNGTSFSQKQGIFSNRPKDFKYSLLRESAGKRHYGATSIVPSITFGRLFLGYFYTHQIAAIYLGEQDSEDVWLRQREDSGPVLGFSGKDDSGRIFLGLMVSYINRKEVFGGFNYDDIETSQDRKRSFEDKQTSYSGIYSSVALSWVAEKKNNVVFNVTAINPASFKLKVKETLKEDYSLKNPINLGFGVSPNVGQTSSLNYVLQFNDLTEPKKAIVHKVATSLEYMFGFSKTSKKDFAIRLGYNKVGISYGLKLSLGMIKLEYSEIKTSLSSESSSIRKENKKTAVLSIDVADI